MSAVIEASDLTRFFGDRPAVNEVSFRVEAGEVFGLLGPNGAGKTTLVRLLNGVLLPSRGIARVLDYDPQIDGDLLRARTGVLTEQPALYERLTARENLQFFGTMYDVAESDLNTRVSELLETFDLTSRADDRAGGYSKGMKQRLALARTLIHRPPLLFFDEPTAGLDPEAAQSVTDLIAYLSRQDGRTVFLCTHNLEEAERLCDRVAVINQGRLLATGSTTQLGRDLWQGTWVDFELHGAPPAELENAVRGLPTVTGIEMNGTRLAVQVTAEDAIPAVVAGVVTAGAAVLRVNPRAHSLRDIYFKLQAEAKS